MQQNMIVLSVIGLLALGACHPNGAQSIRFDLAEGNYQGRSHYTGTHPYAKEKAFGSDSQQGMEQPYEGCSPAEVRRSDC